MFYGANRAIFIRAAKLRSNMTEAENVLWKVLRNKDVFKVRFKRQHPIDIFIVDFYCHQLKLAIEVDGEIHLLKKVNEYDAGRQHDIEKLGIKILRFTNKEILEDLEAVKKRIMLEMK